MHITVSAKPNALGTYRYDVRAAGRSTYGFRTTESAAQQAAREDGSLLYLAGSSDRAEEDRAEKESRRRQRDDR
jgi:hypothetical protein